MNRFHLPVFSLLLLWTAYVSGTYQRNVTYFQDDVCGLRLSGSMSNETIQKYGSRLKDTTQEWLSVNVDALQHWRGNGSWWDGCPVKGNITGDLESVETLPIMYILDYIAILEQTEQEKMGTLLIRTCKVQHASVRLLSVIKTYLCYLLAGITSLKDATNTEAFEMNLSSDVVSRTDVADFMGLVASWGECVGERGVRGCIHDVGFFQGC